MLRETPKQVNHLLKTGEQSAPNTKAETIFAHKRDKSFEQARSRHMLLQPLGHQARPIHHSSLSYFQEAVTLHLAHESSSARVAHSLHFGGGLVILDLGGLGELLHEADEGERK